MNAIVEADQDETPSSAVVANPFGGQVAQAPQHALAQAAEQRAIAEVQASFVMAQRFPRDERGAVDRIINTFGRYQLAESASYQYARGGEKISGPSIRAAEAIAQQWGNMDFGFSEVSRIRDERGIGISIVRAQAVDLQSRVRRYVDFHVRHWRDTKSGGYALSEERDIYELVANMAQRRVRACILALVPGDVIETAMVQAERTLKAKVDISAEGIKKMLETFDGFGVTKEQIEKRIQRRLETIDAGQMVTLKRIYASLRDGMSAPRDWFETDDAPAGTPEAIANLNAKASAKSRAPKPAAAPAPAPVDQTPAAEQPAGAKPAAPAATPAPAKDAGPAPTFAQVMDKIHAAANADELDVAGDLIGEVLDAGQRDELTAEYRRIRAELDQ